MSQQRAFTIRVDDLAKTVKGQVIGQGDTLITGVASLEQAGPTDLVFVMDTRLREAQQASHVGAILVSQPLKECQRPQIIVSHPQYAFTQLVHRFFYSPPSLREIASEVSQGVDVEMGPDVAIGSFVTIGNHVKIGARVKVFSGVYLGDFVYVGDDTILYPNVTILNHCVIGFRSIIHSGTVIGSDGFGYVQHEGLHHKIPQLGNVVIEDDVEIGANVTIDRGTFGQTTVKRGTKIDNLVQIAHNVTVGEDAILVAQAGIAGSTTIGQHVMIGGQAGLIDHLSIGDRVMIAAGSGVGRNVEAGQVVSGRPALPHEAWLKTQILVQKLPELRQQLLELEKRIKLLESNGSHSRKAKTKKNKAQKK